jgi:hypothetical protein
MLISIKTVADIIICVESQAFQLYFLNSFVYRDPMKDPKGPALLCWEEVQR